ncbi:MAG: sensor histidine kinase [Minisyncoccota bacterium]
MPEQKPLGILWGIVNGLIGLFGGLYVGSWLLKAFVYPGATDVIVYEKMVSDWANAPQVFWLSVSMLGLGAFAGLLTGLCVSFAQLWINQRAYTRALRAVSISKDAFISMVLHHIRTPLTGIKWVLSALGSEDKENMLTLENLHALKLENERAITAVNKLLEAARVSSEQTTYQIEIRPLTEVYALLEKLIEATHAVAAAKGIELGVSLTPPPLESYIAIDKEKIQIVLEGLLNNAIKYTAKGGSVSVAMSVTGRRLRFAVSDTGIGIPTAQQEKIFSQFFRADNARVKEPDGFGVGLFVSKTFVRRMGGTIVFTSEVGKGTTFTVELPLIGDAGERFLTGLTSTPSVSVPIGSTPRV